MTCICFKYLTINDVFDNFYKSLNYNRDNKEKYGEVHTPFWFIELLLDKINKFAPIKHILKNKLDNEDQVIELLDDISKDLFNYDLEFRIQELESRFSKDMSETTFNELKELKNERKIN